MRIAIDARWIFAELSGIGAYTRELIRRIPGLDPDNEYVLLFDRPNLRDRTLAETGLVESDRLRTRVLPYGVFSAAGQCRLPLCLRSLGIDVFHSTNYMLPFLAFPRHRRGRIACVATVHDVIPLLFPGHAPRSKKTRLFHLYRRLMIEVGARADAIIADSLASRADVIARLRIRPGRQKGVHAIYCGVDERFLPAPRDTHPRGARNLLYVGRSDPYKNLVTLVRVFSAVRKAAPFEVTLTLAGSRDPRYPEALAAAGELGVADAVRWTGYLPDVELVRLYTRADVLVHPSRYEGFGLPVAEAMACGLPVVCSRAGALPEVTGDAAVLLDPDDVDGFASHVLEILENPAVAAAMREQGLRQAARFTWTRTAEQTVEVYRGLVSPKCSV